MLWLKNGNVVVDSSNKPIDCDHCPCVAGCPPSVPLNLVSSGITACGCVSAFGSYTVLVTDMSSANGSFTLINTGANSWHLGSAFSVSADKYTGGFACTGGHTSGTMHFDITVTCDPSNSFLTIQIQQSNSDTFANNGWVMFVSTGSASNGGNYPNQYSNPCYVAGSFSPNTTIAKNNLGVATITW